MPDQRSDAYQRVQHLIAGNQCVILDGGVATELERIGLRDYRISDENLWGTWALYHAPYAALDVHRRYVAAGCDIISTDTWAIINAPEMETRSMMSQTGPSHWMERRASRYTAGASGDRRSETPRPMRGGVQYQRRYRSPAAPGYASTVGAFVRGVSAGFDFDGNLIAHP